jgi:hypothetical protein
VEGEVHDYYEEHRDVLREAGVWLLTSDDPDEDYIDEESDEDSNDESCAHCGY